MKARLSGHAIGNGGMANKVRQKGTITRWNGERGFGFVTPAGGGEPLFLHITAICDRSRTPVEGDIVTYDLAIDERKRRRAINVKRSMPTRSKPQAMSASRPGIALPAVTSLFVLFVTAVTLAGRLPPAVIAIYAVVSILTFLVYWWDKAAARHDRWRVKESSLLLLGLAGGWPGAVVAQRVLHHKTRKSSFQAAFWGTVIINSVGVGWLLTDTGSQLLEGLLK
ncbi:MAG TPA: DUF1294 domain-containing protein [Steroidobacteraceae bacterium]|nr:DUF1294 domain-containing protein [Steroidobacteraceae bacterium]